MFTSIVGSIVNLVTYTKVGEALRTRVPVLQSAHKKVNEETVRNLDIVTEPVKFNYPFMV